MVFIKRILRFSAILLFVSVLLSCGYGFLNFAPETGSLEIGFEMVTDNPRGIDRIGYEFTPPEGLSSYAERKFSGFSEYYNLDNATAGTWHIHLSLFADGSLIQEYDYDVEVTDDRHTLLKLECSWDSSGYTVSQNIWQESEDSSSTGGNSEAEEADPVFTVSEVRIMPAVYEDYYTGERQYAVDIRILGSGFYPDLESIELEYPDGSLYSFGYYDYYGRTVQFSHSVEDGMIEIQRNIGDDDSGVNGTYSLYLSDVNDAAASFNREISYDYDLYMPDISSYENVTDKETLSVVPRALDSADKHNFTYSFNSSVGAGTRLVFILDRDRGTIFPSDDSIAVSGFDGILDASGVLAAGNYELILAAVEHATTAPVTEGSAAGISSPDLRSETLVKTLYSIYGEDTGFIFFKSALFTVY